MDNQFFQSAQYIQVTFLGTNKVKNEKNSINSANQPEVKNMSMGIILEF